MPEDTEAGLVAQEALRLQPGNGNSSIGIRRRLRTVRFVAYGVLKRGLDLVLSATLLIMLSPVLLVVAVAVKIDSPGPALFRQKRTGKNGKEFGILKFRSMTVDNDVSDSSCDDKYTRIGGVLRRTSLDELPQLINVLMGQMSFIGPRPWIKEYWTNMDEEERERAKVRPGITGLAAAKGRNDLTIFEKIAYDLEYVRNYSLWQDVKVIVMTVKTVLTHEGAEAGKGGIHDEIGELKVGNKGPRVRVVLKMDPMVSIKVPLSSGTTYMKERISSALGHTCEDVELVVMGGDSDSVKKMKKNFASETVRVVDLRGSGGDNVNMGVGDNVSAGVGVGVGKVGVEKAKGRFLCFVDADNSWRPNKMAALLDGDVMSETSGAIAEVGRVVE